MPRTEVELLAQCLEVGDTVTERCPFCQSQDNKLSITRIDTGILYNCYRASCGARGFVPTAGYLLTGSPETRKAKRSRKFSGEKFPLDIRDTLYFEARFGIPPQVAREVVSYDDQNRYLVEARGPRGEHRGYTARCKPWTGGVPSPRQPHSQWSTKSVWYPDREDTMSMSWYGYSRKTTVLVEDQISALKLYSVLGDRLSAVSLHGTGLDQDKVREIAMERPRQVLIALDADALGVALGHAAKWGLAFHKTRVVPLSCDIKDMAEDDIREGFGEYV